MPLKDKFARYVFKKATQFKRRKRETVAISNAKTIGILFDATHQHQIQTIQKFAENLRAKGKIVTIFGFYNKKKLPPDFNQLLCKEVITRADLHWYGIPYKKAYSKMSEEPFDLLINSCIWHCVPLLLVAAASQAKFRVGKYFEDATNCFDFMLNTEANTSLENFLTLIEDFSTKLKK